MVSSGGISTRKRGIFKAVFPYLPCLFPPEDSSKKARKGAEDCQNIVAAHDSSEVVCKICRGPGVDESPLHYSYACGGSIKHVHEDCLLRWLNRNKGVPRGRFCEDDFKFPEVYTEIAPSKPSFRELSLGVALKVARGSLVSNLCSLFCLWTVWFLDIPFSIPFMSASKALSVCVTFFAFGNRRRLGWRIKPPGVRTVVLAKLVTVGFGQWIFPRFGYSTNVNSAFNVYFWIGSLALGVGWFALKDLADLQNDIRDDLSIVDRRRLHTDMSEAERTR